MVPLMWIFGNRWEGHATIDRHIRRRSCSAFARGITALFTRGRGKTADFIQALGPPQAFGKGDEGARVVIAVPSNYVPRSSNR